MKKLLSVLALVVLASSAYAAVQIKTTTVLPVVDCKPAVLDIAPATIGQVDLSTGAAIADPVTGLQKTLRTWNNYMYFATQAGGSRVVHLQSLMLEKIHPERKVSCGAAWVTAKNTVFQQGIQDVQSVWPLLYEVDGTEIRLTVTYNTDIRVGYDPTVFGPNTPSRSHTEVYSWIVDSHQFVGAPVSSLSFTSLNARLCAFSKLPAGTCEVMAITPAVLQKINTFIYGFGSTALNNYIPGIQQYLLTGNAGKPGAAQRFSDIENYIDSVCNTACEAGLYTTGVNAGTPDPNAQFIIDNPTVPAASVLLNDVWAVGKAMGVLTDKK